MIVNSWAGGERRAGHPSAWRLSAWVAVPLLAVIFGVAHAQYPLYYLTQNQYFFHGLARAGLGLLRHDWLAATADPWPLFSLLVEGTVRLLDPRAFYVYYLVLLGVYAYSLLGIVTPLFGLDRSRARLIAAVLLLTVLHAPLVLLGLESIIRINAKELLVGGVALQRILWDMLHPGAFGVFLLLSIYLFLREKPFWAVASAVFAASVHPTYMLSAGVLSLSYVVILAMRRRGMRQPLAVAAWAAACIFPIAAYMVLTFRGSAPDVSQQAYSILMRELARHAVIAQWFDVTVIIKLGLIGIALYLVRRTELFWIMAISLTSALALTLVQVVTGSPRLALLYPWRPSVYLVPLAIMIVGSYLLGRILDAMERRAPAAYAAVPAVSAVLILVLVAAGAWEMLRHRNLLVKREEPIAVYDFVEKMKRPDHVYLIPLKWRYFRLYTRAPVYADVRFNPYADVEVLEWDRRVKLAEQFYAASADGRCEVAAAMAAARGGPTHAVVSAGDPARCGWMMEFDGGEYRVYRLSR